ncbi:sperm-egg fusion protein Juno [Dermatophagoides farinae]|uniref:GTP-binding protein, variant 2 n=2 Tax=Dermatophagoides farinae TaxID=6954 RepID=A0A922HT76_DERFA|nr:folate receptor alpha-like [Dermatophagoides farinae]KAH9501442.1 GTP-binding protein, variant 2 [Dermatophagoides farinae]
MEKMSNLFFIQLLSLIFLILFIHSIDSNHVGTCLHTKNHLRIPVPNISLYEECSPWSENSCCDRQTSILSHQMLNQFNFNLSHCGLNSISAGCLRYFIKDLCYYNCDPYIEPWIVKIDSKFGPEDYEQERIVQVPLCESDCIEWWNQCSESSLTCVRNWRKHFEWNEIDADSMITNHCPNGAQCIPFKFVYKDAYDFCQTVWDNRWKVVQDTEQCITFEFGDGNQSNPNRLVAEYYLNEHLKLLFHIDLIPLFMELFIFVIFVYFIVTFIVKICKRR